MNVSSRRAFICVFGVLSATTLIAPQLLSRKVMASEGARVVVVGGGFGGATCAKYLRRYSKTLNVTLIEKNQQFVTCPFSNAVIGGLRGIDSITHAYDGLADRGITVVHDVVSEIDPVAKRVTLSSGKTVVYDRLVVSPGVSFRREGIENYAVGTEEVMPHAWKGGQQTVLLKKQLESMPDGGVVLVSIPPPPYRAPPAPYERASLIANYFKKNKPKSKVVILNAGHPIDEIDLFKEAWDKLYPGMIELVEGNDDAAVKSVDTKAMTVSASSGTVYKGDVINVIPPQQAGDIAISAGLTNASGWCEVNPATFESVVHKDVHVIGDASVAGDMPKTGHAANSQAKICAAAIVTGLTGQDMPAPVFSTGIYSLIGDKYAISKAGLYRIENGRIKNVSGGVSELSASRKIRLKETRFAFGWYKSITADMFL